MIPKIAGCEANCRCIESFWLNIKELFYFFFSFFCKVARFSFQKETFVCLPHVRVGTNEKENLICATQRVQPGDELFSLLHAFPHFLNVNFSHILKKNSQNLSKICLT